MKTISLAFWVGKELKLLSPASPFSRWTKTPIPVPYYYHFGFWSASPRAIFLSGSSISSADSSDICGPSRSQSYPVQLLLFLQISPSFSPKTLSKFLFFLFSFIFFWSSPNFFWKGSYYFNIWSRSTNLITLYRCYVKKYIIFNNR